MEKKELLYEGKAKQVYATDDENIIVMHFKDDATAGNGAKSDVIAGKGILNNRISEHIMLCLQEIGIPTHFIRRLNMREQLVKVVEIIPLEVVVRNRVAGSMAKRFDLPEGQRLPRPIVEFYYKNDPLGDPLVSEDHIVAFGWACPQDIEDMVGMAMRINDCLCGLFMGIGIQLVDFKLEFGRRWEGEDMRIILADEISPDNCRLWDRHTQEKLDKDRFRRDMGHVKEAYQEVARRMGILSENNANAVNLVGDNENLDTVQHLFVHNDGVSK